MVDHRLTVLGAGVMGTGITTLALRHGVPVTLADVAGDVLDRARARIDHGLRMAQLIDPWHAPVEPGLLVTSTSPLEAAQAGGTTAIIEAITEDATLKADVLAEVSVKASPSTLLISNTSSIPIDELAGWVSRPENLLGTHFMNPPYLIPTVEVVRGARTGQVALESIESLLDVLRCKMIVVQDAPGFVTSRLLHPMINDAARVVQEGTASVTDVDTLMRGCLGHPTGPLRTADLIGIDNLVDSLWVLHERTGDERSRPCDLMLQKVRDGHHGRKTGRGFYEYGREFS